MNEKQGDFCEKGVVDISVEITRCVLLPCKGIEPPWPWGLKHSIANSNHFLVPRIEARIRYKRIREYAALDDRIISIEYSLLKSIRNQFCNTTPSIEKPGHCSKKETAAKTRYHHPSILLQADHSDLSSKDLWIRIVPRCSLSINPEIDSFQQRCESETWGAKAWCRGFII